MREKGVGRWILSSTQRHTHIFLGRVRKMCFLAAIRIGVTRMGGEREEEEENTRTFVHFFPEYALISGCSPKKLSFLLQGGALLDNQRRRE